MKKQIALLLAVMLLTLSACASTNNSPQTDDPAQMLQDALSGIFNKTGKKVVIIIDEYDNNITENIEEKDRDTAEEMRKVLNDFFKMIKNSSEYISFCFITGVVKLSHLSIFSAMNNLVDLTMDEDFAGAFGYTDEEFDEYFSEGIDEYLEANPGKYESRAEFRQMIKEYYDGYRFSPDSEMTVYNPVSIGFFFENKCRFRNYWHKTGRSTIAIKLAKHLDLSHRQYGTCRMTMRGVTCRIYRKWANRNAR